MLLHPTYLCTCIFTPYGKAHSQSLRQTSCICSRTLHTCVCVISLPTTRLTVEGRSCKTSCICFRTLYTCVCVFSRPTSRPTVEGHSHKKSYMIVIVQSARIASCWGNLSLLPSLRGSFKSKTFWISTYRPTVEGHSRKTWCISFSSCYCNTWCLVWGCKE